MKKYIIAFALILSLALSISLVSASIELVEDMGPGEDWPCDEFKVIQKTFHSESEDIYMGLLCPTDSRIEILDCTSGECVYNAQGYKKSGSLPMFNGFDVREKYSYQCYACEGTCALSVIEGDEVNLNNFFIGMDFKISDSEANLDGNGVWQTKVGDEGIYDVFVDLSDGEEFDKVEFCIDVLEEGTIINENGTVEKTEKYVSLVESAGPNDDWPCDEYKARKKVFDAESEEIYMGLWCPVSARLEVFDCTKGECYYSTQAYKNDGQLPLFDGFEIGEQYSYQCYACEGAKAYSLIEGDVFDINDYIQGVDFEIDYSETPFDENGVWKTDRGDRGVYDFTMKIYDDDLGEWRDVDFSIEVNPGENSPAKLTVPSRMITVNEGQNLELNVDCNDADGDDLEMSIFGWMDSTSKQVSYDDAGDHAVVISCIDSLGEGTYEGVTVRVVDQNRPPQIEVLGLKE